MMNKLVLLCIPLLSLAMGLAGCSTHGPLTGPTPATQPARVGPGTDLSDHSAVLKVLYQHHRDWKGVPYRYGGMSKKGTDCSGLVNTIYRNKFGVGVPRTTARLRGVGSRVRRVDLQPGDLVFFSGHGLKSHVGIYVEKNLFLHASVSSGVMLSRMNNPYWYKRYEQARRVRF